MLVKSIMSSFTAKNKYQTYREGHLLPVMRAAELLAASPYQVLLSQLKDMCGLPEEYYKSFYLTAINNFVEFVQVLPIDFSGVLCGLMNRGIARAMVALRVYQQEHKKAVDPLLSYAIFTAALFQNVAHVLINQRVILTEENGTFVDNWQPFKGSMVGRAQFYRLIPLAPIYQRLDFALRYLFTRQLMPEKGFQWIAADLHILADWFDAIGGEGDQGGVLAHILAHIKRDDVIDLQDALEQVLVQQKKGFATEHGDSFYRWLKDGIEGNDIVANAPDSGLYIVNEGAFIEREKLFRDFLETYNQPVTLSVVYAQFGNLMGIAKKGGYDFMNAQYFSDASSHQTSAHNLGGLIGGKKSSLKNGMLVSTEMIFRNKVPAVSPLVRAMQSKGITYRDLPSLDRSNTLSKKVTLTKSTSSTREH